MNAPVCECKEKVNKAFFGLLPPDLRDLSSFLCGHQLPAWEVTRMLAWTIQEKWRCHEERNEQRRHEIDEALKQKRALQTPLPTRPQVDQPNKTDESDEADEAPILNHWLEILEDIQEENPARTFQMMAFLIDRFDQNQKLNSSSLNAATLDFNLGKLFCLSSVFTQEAEGNASKTKELAAKLCADLSTPAMMELLKSDLESAKYYAAMTVALLQVHPDANRGVAQGVFEDLPTQEYTGLRLSVLRELKNPKAVAEPKSRRGGPSP